MKINKPELKVVRFANEDVIATSLFAVSNGSGGYDVYDGAITSAVPETDGWHVNMGDLLFNWTESDYLTNRNSIIYDNVYDAYLGTYNDSQYYSNGVAYPKLATGGGQGAVGGDNGLDD